MICGVCGEVMEYNIATEYFECHKCCSPCFASPPEPEERSVSKSGGGFLFSHKIRKIADEVVLVTSEKNEAYGNSVALSGKILEILYPNGISTEQYTDVMIVSRIIDKLFRVANRKDAFGESPYRDITGYGLCGAQKDEE